jgi:energy-coupling factor transporter ATP-binding protein EcfA2
MPTWVWESGALSIAGRKAATDFPAASAANPLARGGDATLEALHEPTAKIVHQLKQARLRLERASSPELRLHPAIRALRRTELRLDRPLRVAVLGETNSGKSSLANLLAGIESLPTAVISNTRIATLLYHAREPEIWMAHYDGSRERLRGDVGLPRRSIFRIEVGLPSARLRAMQVLDLPGSSDLRSGGPDVDLGFHQIDAALWCTMSTQAWKESERCAWSMLPARLHERGILVSTHCDLLRDPADRRKLLERLHQDVESSFRSIVLLSTLDAVGVMARDRKGLAGATWLASGADTLGTELAALLSDLREQRAAAALRMTSRIAQRALSRIDNRPAPPWTSTQ